MKFSGRNSHVRASGVMSQWDREARQDRNSEEAKAMRRAEAEKRVAELTKTLTAALNRKR